ncbi:MAG: ATP synthase F1 subunit gamma [Syntrophomonadaceae bacterium]|jgi:F-type H+-transporting ATPase subunit gamma
MSVQLQNTKRRIRSIKATEKITSAMEMVAVTKLKVWEYRLHQNEKYRTILAKVSKDLLSGVKREDSLYFRSPEGASKTFHVVFASDMGLCGAYNNTVLSFADEAIKSGDTVLTIGKRAYRHFAQRNDLMLIDEFVDIGGAIKFLHVLPLERRIESAFRSGEYQAIKLHFTRYINSMTTRPNTEVLLPIGGAIPFENEKLEPIGPIIEPDKKGFIDEFIPLYLQNVLYFTLMSAEVAEQSMRRMAMKQATDNANDLLDELQIRYNMARQAAITQEISELVSGSL